jgi:hypothetical protein
MKTRLFAILCDRIAKTAALILFIALAVPVFAQIGMVNMSPAIAASSTITQLPKGTKVIASVSLEGQPVTRMYTQTEYGRTYLYIEHGRQSLTTVDISKKRNPLIVNREPGKVEPARYEQLSEGGSVQVSPQWHVNEGIDNQGGRGMLSVLESNDPDDANLLQAFGPKYSNLADRDRRLVYFASPSQLLVVQDNRLTAIDFITN